MWGEFLKGKDHVLHHKAHRCVTDIWQCHIHSSFHTSILSPNQTAVPLWTGVESHFFYISQWLRIQKRKDLQRVLIENILRIRPCSSRQYSSRRQYANLYELPLTLEIILSGDYKSYQVSKPCTLLFRGQHNISLYLAVVLSLKSVNRMPKLGTFSCELSPSKITTNQRLNQHPW